MYCQSIYRSVVGYLKGIKPYHIPNDSYILNSIIKTYWFYYSTIMETATVLIIFIASLLFGVTGYSMYTAFGPGSKDLRDPFEDHGAIRFRIIYT